jgi:hypothetical protein
MPSVSVLFPSILELRANTDPASLVESLDDTIERAQFCEPLPQKLLEALAQALRTRPQVALRAYGMALDPSLAFLEPFEFVEKLFVDLWNVESFAPLGRFTQLRVLGLGETKSSKPSLRFLESTPLIEELYVGKHVRDLEVLASLSRLRKISLAATKGAHLAALRGLPLAVVLLYFGSARDLSFLAALPQLRAVTICQIKQLESADLEPLAAATSLDALELINLPHVESLAALGAPPRLRLASLEGLRGLTSLDALARWSALEDVALDHSRARDGRLAPLAGLARLQSIAIGDRYAESEVAAFRRAFRGERLFYRGEWLVGAEAERSFSERLVTAFATTTSR